jgi:hypothetical protein
MFNGFPSTQTPTVQFWDFSKSTDGVTDSVSLASDCAPVQYFATGNNTTSINLYLPVNTVNGKTIIIKNDKWFSNSSSLQSIIIYDISAGQFKAVSVLGVAGSITLCYIFQNTLSGQSTVGRGNWVSISNSSSQNPQNYYSVNGGGYNNKVQAGYSTVSGGSTNTAGGSSAAYSTVAGGNTNIANGSYSAIGGGGSNTSAGTSSVVSGGNTNSAAGLGSAVCGGISNSANNSYSAVGGGTSNVVNGQYATVAGGNTNSASGLYATIPGGSNNIASGSAASCLGGGDGTASANFATTVGGNVCTASGQYAVTLGGNGSLSNAEGSLVLGGVGGTTRLIVGNAVSPACSAPISTNAGTQQTATLLLGVQTTNATATVLRSNTSAASGTNQVILPNNSAYYFRGELIAGKTAAGDTKGWYIEGVIKRGANAASTAIVGTASVTSLYADAGAATWAVTATADTTLGGLKIEVTGQAATTIRWVCQIRTTEMTF